ncbi:hypothetical protein BT69DRAFT_1334648 [Atractiella rhizophila]|nr:hypothetical protein BT69DRAFT_1334648 [Atractiella rhizophila]
MVNSTPSSSHHFIKLSPSSQPHNDPTATTIVGSNGEADSLTVIFDNSQAHEETGFGSPSALKGKGKAVAVPEPSPSSTSNSFYQSQRPRLLGRRSTSDSSLPTRSILLNSQRTLRPIPGSPPLPFGNPASPTSDVERTPRISPPTASPPAPRPLNLSPGIKHQASPSSSILASPTSFVHGSRIGSVECGTNGCPISMVREWREFLRCYERGEFPSDRPAEMPEIIKHLRRGSTNLLDEMILTTPGSESSTSASSILSTSSSKEAQENPFAQHFAIRNRSSQEYFPFPNYMMDFRSPRVGFAPNAAPSSHRPPRSPHSRPQSPGTSSLRHNRTLSLNDSYFPPQPSPLWTSTTLPEVSPDLDPPTSNSAREASASSPLSPVQERSAPTFIDPRRTDPLLFFKEHGYFPAPVDREQREARERVIKRYGLDVRKNREILERCARLAKGFWGTTTVIITFLLCDHQLVTSEIGWSNVVKDNGDGTFDMCDLAQAICPHSVLRRDGQPFVVEDAGKDWRFENNPFVKDGGGIQFYAGANICLKADSSSGSQTPYSGSRSTSTSHVATTPGWFNGPANQSSSASPSLSASSRASPRDSESGTPAESKGEDVWRRRRLSEERVPVGTFCLIDNKPRTFTDHDKSLLSDLAAIISKELESAWQQERRDKERRMREFLTTFLSDAVLNQSEEPEKSQEDASHSTGLASREDSRPATQLNRRNSKLASSTRSTGSPFPTPPLWGHTDKRRMENGGSNQSDLLGPSSPVDSTGSENSSESPSPPPQNLASLSAPPKKKTFMFDKAAKSIAELLDADSCVMLDLRNFYPSSGTALPSGKSSQFSTPSNVTPFDEGPTRRRSSKVKHRRQETGDDRTPTIAPSLPQPRKRSSGTGTVAPTYRGGGSISFLGKYGGDGWAEDFTLEDGGPTNQKREDLRERLSKFLANYDRTGISRFDGRAARHALAKLLPDDCQASICFPFFDHLKNATLAIIVTSSAHLRFEIDDAAFVQSVGAVCLASLMKKKVVEADQAKLAFVSQVSHELRSPLYSIVGQLELIRMACPPELLTKIDPLLSAAFVCGETLGQLLEDVLDYGKLSNATDDDSKAKAPLRTLTTVDLAALAEEVARGSWMRKRKSEAVSVDAEGPKNASELPNDVDIILEVEDRKGGWLADVDVAGLKRVLINIMGNSLKFTWSGWVKMTLRELHTSRKTAKKGVRIVSFVVQDTGIGMDEEFLKEKLFLPFKQQNPFSSGAGLGMSIVDSIVRRMGGKIEATSTFGQGTTITVILPLHLCNLDPDPHEPTPLLKEGETLITEDNVKFRRSIISDDLKKLFDNQMAGASPLAPVISADSPPASSNINTLAPGDPQPNGSVLGAPELKVATASSSSTDFTVSTEPESQTSFGSSPRKLVTVLVADDNMISRNVMTRMLKMHNFTYYAASDGQEAYDLYRKHRPTVVYMDLQMPNVDGLTATRWIRAYEEEERLPRSRIIALTGLSNEVDMKRGYLSGADDWVVKGAQSLPDLAASLIRLQKDFDEGRTLPPSIQHSDNDGDDIIENPQSIDYFCPQDMA